MPNLTIHLKGDLTRTTATNSQGDYEFTDLAEGGNYTLTANSEAENPVNQGVTTLDLALIRQHILALTKLDAPYKILAADVDNSGSVTTLDIALIRRVILGIRDSFPGRNWVFVPSDLEFGDPLNPWQSESSRSYTNLSNAALDQNFIAIKHGDVNGSWTQPLPFSQ